MENSWGAKKGDDGNWYMYDNWFNEYVLTVVIASHLLDPEDAEKMKREPVKIPMWDPFLSAFRRL